MLRLAILISGGGSTMLSIIRACQNGVLDGLIEPALILASKDGIKGIERARDAGIQTSDIVVCSRGGSSDLQYGESLLALLGLHKVDLIVQAGWMPLTPVKVIKEYEGRIWNQHPTPLDTGHLDFGGKGMHGLRAHCARLYFSRKRGLPEDQFTEATAHFVTERFDEGAVIGRIRVPIEPYDDVTTLAERVLPVEHELQIATARQFAEKTVRPQPRESRLIEPGQEDLLLEAKTVAGLLFPKG